QSARPYAQTFSSSRHLMMQLEIDRQFSHRAGTWAAGLGVGYFNVTAAALSADLQSPSGDQTGLRLIPLSASLVYRADQLRRRFGSPLVPYAKTGLDCTFWQITDTSQPNFDGHTFGWHAAAGITVDLSPLDREAAESLRRESGVDQLALFAEAAYFRLDNFGSGSALRVGDTTWFAGLMIEF
ncbi:MAG TPA: MXAN_2562 family outer membrane beta-barrel protein, partial [Polyangia bacterium]|nr:MXAN_2562 family outer membrane beta-barrel protein [Polyangia bacterium]